MDNSTTPVTNPEIAQPEVIAQPQVTPIGHPKKINKKILVGVGIIVVILIVVAVVFFFVGGKSKKDYTGGVGDDLKRNSKVYSDLKTSLNKAFSE